MIYTIWDKIELAVNEIFDFKGSAMQVVSDYDGCCSCDACVFHEKPECQRFECLSENRVDDTDVHFIKFKEVVYENK